MKFSFDGWLSKNVGLTNDAYKKDFFKSSIFFFVNQISLIQFYKHLNNTKFRRRVLEFHIILIFLVQKLLLWWPIFARMDFDIRL